MPFPICESCAKDCVLCASCEEKVRKGEVSALEVLLSQILAKHKAKGFGEVRDFETRLVIFASEEDAPAIIGRGGYVAKELSDKLGKRIIVIVPGWDLKTTVSSIVRPANLIEMKIEPSWEGESILRFILDKHIDERTRNFISELCGG